MRKEEVGALFYIRVPKCSMKLIYDPYYFKDFLSKANGNTEDLDFCVSMERIEEAKEFSRRMLPSVSYERFNWSGDSFVRLGNISVLKENLHKLEGTKLYPDMKRRENLEYWWRFIPPLYRKFTEFTIEEIYEKPQSEWRSELREVLRFLLNLRKSVRLDISATGREKTI